MHQSDAENGVDVVVAQGVVLHLAFLPHAHDIDFAQHRKLVLHGGVLHAEKRRKVAYAHLAEHQGVDELEPRRVRHDLEKVRHLEERILALHS